LILGQIFLEFQGLSNFSPESNPNISYIDIIKI